MATIAVIDLPAEEFALHQTLSALDTVEVEVERVVAQRVDTARLDRWIRPSEW